MRRLLTWGTCILFGLVLLLEAVLRFQFGLASPPLYVEHPTIEYQPRPNQNVRFFGKLHIYNQQGMRTFPLEESDYDRLVLALGDSVINGGNTLGHAELATTLASQPSQLHTSPRKTETLFGNVSAKSWGPGNLVSWINEYGFMGADTAVFVFSSHDVYDVPTFEPLDPRAHPTQPPTLALNFVLTRLADRLIPKAPAAQLKPPGFGQADQSGEDSLRELIDKAAVAGLRVCLIRHQTKSELADQPAEGHAILGEMFHQRGVPVVDFGAIIQERANANNDPFIDDIHINAFGQRLLATALRQCADIARQPTLESQPPPS